MTAQPQWSAVDDTTADLAGRNAGRPMRCYALIGGDR